VGRPASSCAVTDDDEDERGRDGVAGAKREGSINIKNDLINSRVEHTVDRRRRRRRHRLVRSRSRDSWFICIISEGIKTLFPSYFH
jgi:hypothetical protein